MAIREFRRGIAIQRYHVDEPVAVLVEDGEVPTVANAVALLRKLVEIGHDDDRHNVEVSVELLRDLIVEPLERGLRDA